MKKISDEEIKYLLFKPMLDRMPKFKISENIEISEYKKAETAELIFNYDTKSSDKHPYNFYIKAIAVCMALAFIMLMPYKDSNVLASFMRYAEDTIGYTRYLFKETDEKEISYPDEITLEVGYIPKGYENVSVSSDKNQSTAMYDDANENYIMIIKHKKPFHVEIYTGDNDKTTEIVDGKSILISRHDKIYTVAWEKNGYIYIVHGKVSIEECKKIVKNIK